MKSLSDTRLGTESYFERYPLPKGVHPVRLGRTQFSVSPIGFGGYRIHERFPEHREALRKALTSGCNLIDTSTNYTDGSSERLMGAVLSELFQEGALRRDQVVVISKAGYVQGQNLKLAHEREKLGRPFSEMIHYHPDCWHCISPEFLEDQITRSLERLRLERLDVLLLHNPEYFLKTDPNHAEYYRRIHQAFEHLEKEAQAGRIQFYGISSNSFPDPKDSPEYTSLETVLEIAESISKDHRFAVIQFPFNLYEPGAAFENNNSGKSVCELALLKDLGTLINRPLNAFSRNQLIRLADFPAHLGGAKMHEIMKANLEKTMAHEATYPQEGAPVGLERIAWGHILDQHLDQLRDLDSWKQVLQFQILPSLAEAHAELSKDPSFAHWIQAHQMLTQELFQGYTRALESRKASLSQKISQALDEACPALRTTPTLSRKVLRVYRSIPGISCVLVGMRKPAYVEDVMRLDPPLSAEQAMHAFDALERINSRHDLIDEERGETLP